MYAVFRSYLDIILLRKGPEDLPASSVLLALSVALVVPGVVLVGLNA